MWWLSFLSSGLVIASPMHAVVEGRKFLMPIDVTPHRWPWKGFKTCQGSPQMVEPHLEQIMRSSVIIGPDRLLVSRLNSPMSYDLAKAVGYERPAKSVSVSKLC